MGRKMKAKSDYIFLGLLGAALLATILITVFSNYILTNYHYAAILCWIVVLVLRILKPRIGQYATGLIIMFGVINILNFILVRTEFLIGIDPYLFCLLIAYYLVNKKPIEHLLKNTIRGNGKERADQHQKMVDFYLDQFENITPAEFEKAFRNLNDYPVEAQMALKIISKK